MNLLNYLLTYLHPVMLTRNKDLRQKDQDKDQDLSVKDQDQNLDNDLLPRT